jgi:hypothetical protein
MSCCLQSRCVPSVCPTKFHETAELAAPWPVFRCARFRCVPLGKNTGAHRRGRERAPRLPAVPSVTGHTGAHRGTPGPIGLGFQIILRTWSPQTSGPTFRL